MTHRVSVRRRLGACLVALGLIAPLGMFIASGNSHAVHAASPIVVDSVNFNDSSTGDWTVSGSPTLDYVDDGSGGKALSISRYNGWDSITSPTGIFAAGTEYTLSMKAMLPASGAVTSIAVRLTVYSKVNGSDSYDWVGNTTINNSGWTTITGTYTLKDGADPTSAKVYVDTDNTNPQSTYAVLVDDILIQTPQTTPPPAPVVIDSVNFNDSSTGDWAVSGGPTLSYVDDGSGGKALDINRFNEWDGISSPAGLMQAGTQYTFSMKAMLPASGPVTSLGARLTVYSKVNGSDSYEWVGNTTINNSGWTTITGTYTLKDGADPSTARVYVDTDNTNPQSAYDVIVDDILITAPGVPSGGGTGVLNSDCSGGYVGLTYDDGPSSANTSLLLAALNAAGLRATFFDEGQNVDNNGSPLYSLVQAQAQNGWVGNHSYSHPDMTTLTADQMTAELTKTQNAIQAAIGTAPVLFRPPYGTSNDTLKSVEASLGLTEITWDVDSQDWNGASTQAIISAVRNAQNGQVILMHDWVANSRAAIPAIADGMNATKKCPGMINPATGKAVAPPPTNVLSTDFENGGLDGWSARTGGLLNTAPTAELETAESHSPTHAVLISNRDEQGDGLSHDVTGLMKKGTKYLITASVKFATGSPTDELWIKMDRGTGGSHVYDTVAEISGVTGSAWKQVVATYTMGDADTASLYFETTWHSSTDNSQDNTASFLVDDVSVTIASGGVPDLTLTPIKDTVSFPVGVAASSADINGWPAALLLHHFNQITLENSMKPEGWYDSNGNFRMSAETKATLDFAVANGLRVYGHTLIWHTQVPSWWFDGPDGVTPLTNSPADQAFFRTRLQNHIFNIAKAISDAYGPFGSSTNPVVAFDVVNEVVSDGSNDPDGLRQSAYYQILGEEYIEDAFNWANQAFNGTYAAAGKTHPVMLNINDYNTDQSGKRQRLHDLVARLIADHVPVDLVGHQFHLSTTTPIENVDAALAAFEDLPVKQVVSELDVNVSTPIDDAKLIEQGYYYRDVFRVFRARSADLFSVTIWGLYDSVSWHPDAEPLVFNDSLQAKPAYRGVVDSPDLEPRIRSANVFQADVPLDASATSALEWQKLPLIQFGTGNKVSFQTRWEPDHLSVYVAISDTTKDATDAITLKLGSNTYTVTRGENDATAVTSESSGGWAAVAHLPLSAAKETDKLQFDVSDKDGSTVTGWNDGTAMGTMTLCEPLSFVNIAPTHVAPTIDGVEDPVWNTLPGAAIETDKQVTGTNTAVGTARLLYQGNTVYLFVHVVDSSLDDTNSNPWEQDSIEIYVDNLNAKSNSYRTDDMQLRINYKNVLSFGSGDTEANQKARVTSATQVVSDGYVVEAAISLLSGGGTNSFIGLDVQVNDGTGGHRVGMRNWADATNAGYLSPSHWGVARLAPDATIPGIQAPSPLKLTATAKDGYHGLTAATAGIAVSDAYDLQDGYSGPSGLTITSNAPAVLPVGTTTVTWKVTDPAGNSSSVQQQVVVAKRVQTEIVYMGPWIEQINKNSSLNMAALLISPTTTCRSGMPVTFSMNRNPLTGAAGIYQVGSANTDRLGIASLRVSTSQWVAGIYLVKATFAGNNVGCVGSSDTQILIVLAPPKKHAEVSPGAIAAARVEIAAILPRALVI